MGLIRPQADEFPDQSELLPPGMHVAKCVAVHDMNPSKAVANGKPRLRFEFTGYDAKSKQLTGKHAVYVCTASVFSGNGKIPASNLVLFAGQAGYPHPEKGVDTSWFVNRWFLIKVRNYEGRAFVDTAECIDESKGKTAKEREKWVETRIKELSAEMPPPSDWDNPPF